MIGSIIGWFFAGLGILLLLLLVVPLTVTVDYSGGVFSLWVRVLFVRLRLMPQKPKTPEQLQKAEQKKREKEAAKQQKKQKKQDEEKKQPEKEKKKRSLEDILNLVRRLASSAGVLMRWVLRGLWIRKVDLVFPVHSEMAGDTAIAVGRLQMLLGATRAVLENVLNIRYKRLTLLPDFTGQFSHLLHFSCKVTASPVIMLIGAIGAGIKFLTWKVRAYSLEDYKAYRRTAESPEAER